MLPMFTRLTFLAVVIASLSVFLIHPDRIQIDTNLNDLNPEEIENRNLQAALRDLNDDIGHRFMVVLQGKSGSDAAKAKEKMQSAIDDLPSLSVLYDDAVKEGYLSSLSPYRFNLLSEHQRQRLENNSAAQIAGEAQRRLYQLGDGVRVIPFNDDPLGWFTDYVMSGLSSVDAMTMTNDGASGSVESFSVVFSTYPKSMGEQAAIYQSLERVKAAVQQDYPVTVLYSGMFFFAVDSASVAKSDIQLIAIGSGVGVIVLMLLVFRSLLPLVLSLSSIAIGIGFGVLASVYTFGSIHVLTIVFGASLIGIVVDYSLHYFYHFLSGHPSPQQSSTKHQTLFRAMFLSVLTSLVGYGALSLSSLLILKKIALFSCTGLLMAWLSVMVLGPLVTGRPIEARQAMLRRIIFGCQSVFARKPVVLKAAGLLLAVACGLYLYMGSVNINDDPRRFFHVSPSLLEQERKVADLAQIYEPGRYLLVQGTSEAAIFDALEALYAESGELRFSFTSILDWLPSEDRQAANYALQSTLYSKDGALDLFAAKLGLPTSQFDKLKAEYVSAEGQTLRFSDLLAQLPSLPSLWIEGGDNIYSFVLINKESDLSQIESVSERIEGVSYMNTLANATSALKAQREAGAQLLLLAYGLIALMLMLYYRQITAVFLLFIPITASIVTLAAVSLLGQAITVFHIMALFLVLGLGMDYIIFAKEMAGQRSTTQQAILLSAVTSLLSFGLLAFSSMPIVQAFGSTILIGNTINFIAAISLFNQRQRSQEKRPGAE